VCGSLEGLKVCKAAVGIIVSINDGNVIPVGAECQESDGRHHFILLFNYTVQNFGKTKVWLSFH
jgi:hypothetical protein